jgi:hypothetical protein
MGGRSSDGSWLQVTENKRQQEKQQLTIPRNKKRQQEKQQLTKPGYRKHDRAEKQQSTKFAAKCRVMLARNNFTVQLHMPYILLHCSPKKHCVQTN